MLSRRYNLVVKCVLPKHNSRVRFPLPAPRCRERNALGVCKRQLAESDPWAAAEAKAERRHASDFLRYLLHTKK